jgi:hypothetical protein
MPTSITPPPKEDETECGNCGAYIYHDLLKCPKCGAYLVNPFPNLDLNEQPPSRPKNKFALWVESVMRREPHVAEELFSGALKVASCSMICSAKWAVTGPWWNG